jgi:hypothetical protein
MIAGARFSLRVASQRAVPNPVPKNHSARRMLFEVGTLTTPRHRRMTASPGIPGRLSLFAHAFELGFLLLGHELAALPCCAS